MILGGCIAESRTPHEDLSIPFCLREHCVQWACSKKFWRLGQLCQTDAYTIKHIYLSVKAFHQSVRPNARSWKVMGYRVHQSGYRRSCEAVSFCPASYKRGPSTLHSSLLKLKTPLTHIEVYIYVCIPISNSGMHTSYESPSDFRVRDCQRLACMHAFQVFLEKTLFMTCVDMFCMSQIDNWMLQQTSGFTSPIHERGCRRILCLAAAQVTCVSCTRGTSGVGEEVCARHLECSPEPAVIGMYSIWVNENEIE